MKIAQHFPIVYCLTLSMNEGKPIITSFLNRSPRQPWYPWVTWYAGPQHQRGIPAGETQSDRTGAHVSCGHVQTVGRLQSAVPRGPGEGPQPGPR